MYFNKWFIIMNKNVIKFMFLVVFLKGANFIFADEIPEAVRQAARDVVHVRLKKSDGFFSDSYSDHGFVVRDQTTGRPFLITSYSVSGSKPNPSDISFSTHEGKQLKIKKRLSYSKKLNLVLFELENYEGSGLKLAKHPIHSGTSSYIVGPKKQIKGTSFHFPKHKVLAFITDPNISVLRSIGFDLPILNNTGEIIGMHSARINGNMRGYDVALKSFYLDKFMSDNPKRKWSDSIPVLPRLYLLDNPFLSRTGFSQLQQSANLGSANAQNMLRRLDKGIKYKGAGFSFNSSMVLLSLAMLNDSSQPLSLLDTFFANAIVVLGGAFAVNQCSDVFRHIRNKVSLHK